MYIIRLALLGISRMIRREFLWTCISNYIKLLDPNINREQSRIDSLQTLSYSKLSSFEQQALQTTLCIEIPPQKTPLYKPIRSFREIPEVPLTIRSVLIAILMNIPIIIIISGYFGVNIVRIVYTRVRYQLMPSSSEDSRL